MKQPNCFRAQVVNGVWFLLVQKMSNITGSWQRRQKESMEFWMSVEAGRQAAIACNRFKQKGNARALEFASRIIDRHSKSDFKKQAVTEFDYALELLEENVCRNDLSDEMIY